MTAAVLVSLFVLAVCAYTVYQAVYKIDDFKDTEIVFFEELDEKIQKWRGKT